MNERATENIPKQEIPLEKLQAIDWGDISRRVDMLGSGDLVHRIPQMKVFAAHTWKECCDTKWANKDLVDTFRRQYKNFITELNVAEFRAKLGKME